MKTILICNAIASMVLIVLSLVAFGYGQITEMQLLALSLFSMFTGILSFYEAENLPYND